MRRHKLIAGLTALGAAIGTGSGVAIAVNDAAGAAAHARAGSASRKRYSRHCPDALPVESRAYFEVARAVQHEVPMFFPNRPRSHFSNRDYTVWGALSLADRDGGRQVELGFPRAELVKTARRACGSKVAQRSWAVVVDFPFAADALFGTHVIYLARSRAGWWFWYDRIPDQGPGRFMYWWSCPPSPCRQRRAG
jgi:hypothetical protein